jgi:short-subunit dehydrogenase
MMKDKVVLITGGSSGIGKALAEVFGKNGARVAITGRNKERLDEAVGAIKSSGVECIGIIADSAVKDDNFRMVAETVNTFGRIDILVNNAGISMRAIFSEADVEVIEKVMQINFFGTIYATKAALPYILRSKGVIVGISSIAGYRGLPGRTGYSSSKFAMNGFLECLRTELLKSGVKVLTACPGFTTSNIRNASLSKDGSVLGETSMDENKMMSAEEVAEGIYKAVVKGKREIIFTALGKATVWLNKLFPGFMDKFTYNYMAKEKGSQLKS